MIVLRILPSQACWGFSHTFLWAASLQKTKITPEFPYFITSISFSLKANVILSGIRLTPMQLHFKKYPTCFDADNKIICYCKTVLWSYEELPSFIDDVGIFFNYTGNAFAKQSTALQFFHPFLKCRRQFVASNSNNHHSADIWENTMCCAIFGGRWLWSGKVVRALSADFSFCSTADSSPNPGSLWIQWLLPLGNLE